jgi:hypothetical protein
MEANDPLDEVESILKAAEITELMASKEKLERRLSDRPISAPTRLILEGTIASLNRRIDELASK